MLQPRLLKKLVAGGAALYALTLLLRWRKVILEWRRVKLLAMQLPSTPVPEKAKSSIDFFGWLKRVLPNGEEFNHETLSRYFVSSIQKVHYQHAKDEGLMCLWIANPKYTPFPVCNVVIWDMDIVREITSAKLLPKMVKSASYAVIADLTGQEGLLKSNHEIWHRQRVVIDRGFTTEYVNKQLGVTRQTARELINKFTGLHKLHSAKDGFVQLDIFEDMMKAIMDNFGRFAFKYEVGSLKNGEAGLYKDYEVVIEILQHRMRNPLLYATRNILPSQENAEFRKRINNIDLVIKTIISERRNNANKSGEEDLLDILLESCRGDGIEDKTTGKMIKLKEEQIITNMRTLFFGGHDTTASALTWAYYLLAKHPEVVSNLRAEFKANGNDMSCEKLETYKYLDAVIIEILRMFPSAPFMKEATEDITVGNGKYVIPKGVEIFFFPFLQHRDPKYFDKPNDFIPARWVDSNYLSENISLQAKSAKISRTEAFFPFALGARNCVGRRLALLQMRVFILEMISAFEMTLPKTMRKGFQECPVMTVGANPKDVEVKFKPRDF